MYQFLSLILNIKLTASDAKISFEIKSEENKVVINQAFPSNNIMCLNILVHKMQFKQHKEQKITNLYYTNTTMKDALPCVRRKNQYQKMLDDPREEGQSHFHPPDKRKHLS